jgi:single-strand DNA-binding protein
MADSFVSITGNITRDPELRYTANGRALASFGVAVNRRYQVNGEWQEQVSYFNVTAWGDLGENVAASASKGSRVTVTGRLEQREYEDKEGNKRTAVDVIADDVAVSLRWATVDISRTAPKGDGGSSAGGSKVARGASDEFSPVAASSSEPF